MHSSWAHSFGLTADLHAFILGGWQLGFAIRRQTHGQF